MLFLEAVYPSVGGSEAGVIGFLQLLCLLVWPPTLFSRLFSLPWYRQALEDWLLPGLQALEQPRLLEVGCAGGDFAKALATQPLAMFAVDRSLHMLARAQRSPGTVQFSQAEAEQLPFPDLSFDVVLAASVLNIVADPRLVLHEMHRVCRPGGVLTVLVPDCAFSRAEAVALADRAQLRGFSRAALLAWHRLGRKMDAGQLTGYFADCGLHHVSSRPILGGMLLAVSGWR